MKGLYLSYVFYVLLFFTFIFISILIIKNISKKPSSVDYRIDSSYFCDSMNETFVNKKEFYDILASFIVGNCNQMNVYIKESISFGEIKKMVNEIYKEKNLFIIQECDFFSTNTGNILINFEKADPNDKIYLSKKEIINSDILVCLIE